MITLTIAGCTSVGLVQNDSVSKTVDQTGYSVPSFRETLSKTNNGILLAFSGGGTRAAALAFGVLQELRETLVTVDGKEYSLLDDVGLISSVSGGSFTAAYFGLHGDKIFSDFESVFLRKDVESALVRNVLNPGHWFSNKSRTEFAIDYYEREIFRGATYADMLRPDAPMILINATDLSRGVRFSFMQEYFNLLCSDLASFPVSRAVTASSAVPMLFSPVVVENFKDCSGELPKWLTDAKKRGEDDPELALTIKGLESYFDKDNHRFAHFVDGGITDNLGLRSIFDMARIAGGGKALLDYFSVDLAPRLVIISVDASTQPENSMGLSSETPGLVDTMNAMTDIQLHRYNTATVSEMKSSIQNWAKQLRTSNGALDAFFVRLSFDDIEDPNKRRYISTIPTSLSLTDKQVDAAISAGRELLRTNPEFQRLLSQIR